jgi:hypothetical protein
LKTSDLILCLARRHAIDPSSVRNNGFSIWLHRVYTVEPDMRTRRARGWPLVLQKYCQNLNGFKRCLRRISELQEDPRFSIHEPDRKRRSTITDCCHNSFCGELIATLVSMYKWSSGMSVRQHTYMRRTKGRHD